MAKLKRSKSKTDEFANFYRVALTSSVDAITFIKWDTGYSLKDLQGFVIHKISWKPSIASLRAMNADGDRINFGLVARNDILLADLEAAVSDSILAEMKIGMRVATNVGETVFEAEYINDFTNEPGGGRLIAPKPLYFAIGSTGIGAPVTASVEVCYTMIDLTQELYRELYESMNPSA